MHEKTTDECDEVMEDPTPRLIEAVIELDERACTSLVLKYAALIGAAIGQAGFFSGDPRDKEEMFYRVAHEVIRSIARWDSDRGAFSTWVYGIARNVVNSFRRDQKRAVEAGKAGDEVRLEEVGVHFDPPDELRPQPGETLTPSAMEVAFWKVYGGLSVEDQVVIDHMLNGGPRRELADQLRTGETAARMRVSRMRKKLGVLVARELGIESPT